MLRHNFTSESEGLFIWSEPARFNYWAGFFCFYALIYHIFYLQIACLRAINILCVGMSFLAFYLYGTVQAYIGWQDAYNTAVENRYDGDGKFHYKIPNLDIPIDVATNMETIQGILAVIMVFCLAEILVGSWMAMMDKSLMIFGSPQDRVSEFEIFQYNCIIGLKLIQVYLLTQVK